jgi:hypothetical protein
MAARPEAESNRSAAADVNAGWDGTGVAAPALAFATPAARRLRRRPAVRLPRSARGAARLAGGCPALRVLRLHLGGDAAEGVVGVAAQRGDGADALHDDQGQHDRGLDKQRYLEKLNKQEVAEDQGRLRANLREVPQTSPLHKRYLDKLNQQGDEVEKHRADIKRQQEHEHARRKALDDFLASFSAD